MKTPTGFVNDQAEAITELLRAVDKLRNLRTHYDQTGIGETLKKEDIALDLNLTVEEFKSAVAAADAVIAAATNTTLYKLRLRM